MPLALLVTFIFIPRVCLELNLYAASTTKVGIPQSASIYPRPKRQQKESYFHTTMVYISSRHNTNSSNVQHSNIGNI